MPNQIFKKSIKSLTNISEIDIDRISEGKKSIDGMTGPSAIKAKLDAVNVDGDTTLISAVDMGRPKLVKYLLEHGADPTITDNAGNKAVDYIGNSAQDSELKVLLEEYEVKWIAEHGEAASRRQSDGQD